MLLYGDYHTHTTYSRHNHGKSSVLDNASTAANKGLKQIAITDHGFNHGFGIRRKDIPNLHEDILNAKEITGVDILLGVEANLISLDGEVDICEEDMDFLDIILMGYHRFIKPSKFSENFSLLASTDMSKIFQPSQEKINKNTTAFLKALDKYPIDVITHLNYGGFQTDTLAVAKMAKQKGVYIELNGKRINFTDDEVLAMAAEGVKFIVNSDAHSADRVGEVNLGMNLIYRLNIPLNLVANVDKIPKFNKKRGGV